MASYRESVERVTVLVILYDLLRQLPNPPQNTLIQWLFQILQEQRGIISELFPQVDQKLLFELPIIEPFLHMLYKIEDALGSELHHAAHLFVLRQETALPCA